MYVEGMASTLERVAWIKSGTSDAGFSNPLVLNPFNDGGIIQYFSYITQVSNLQIL